MTLGLLIINDYRKVQEVKSCEYLGLYIIYYIGPMASAATSQFPLVSREFAKQKNKAFLIKGKLSVLFVSLLNCKIV